MEKPYCVNREEAFEEVKRLTRYDERFPNGLPDNYVPRITGEAAGMLVAQLRDHDNFRRKSLERSGGKVIS